MCSLGFPEVPKDFRYFLSLFAMTYYYSSPTSLDAFVRAVTAQNNLWLPQQSVADLVRALENINFSSRASRNTGLEMMRSLNPVHPFRITGDSTAAIGDIRFSFTVNGASPFTGAALAKVFVNCSKHGWENLLAQARSALSYNDRNNEKTMLTDGSGETQTESVNAPDPEIVRSQFNDASQSFRFATSQMMDLLRNNVSVMNVVSFEREFGLIWSQAAQPPVDE